MRSRERAWAKRSLPFLWKEQPARGKGRPETDGRVEREEEGREGATQTAAQEGGRIQAATEGKEAMFPHVGWQASDGSREPEQCELDGISEGEWGAECVASTRQCAGDVHTRAPKVCRRRVELPRARDVDGEKEERRMAASSMRLVRMVARLRAGRCLVLCR